MMLTSSHGVVQGRVVGLVAIVLHVNKLGPIHRLRQLAVRRRVFTSF